MTTTTGSYTGPDDTSWDALLVSGCHCDSAWSVGLILEKRRLQNILAQIAQKYGGPSGDDPMTDLVETDCENRADNGASTACSNNHYYTNASCITPGYWCSTSNRCMTETACSGNLITGGARRFSNSLRGSSWYMEPHECRSRREIYAMLTVQIVEYAIMPPEHVRVLMDLEVETAQ